MTTNTSAPVNVLAVMDADGRAVALAADSCVGLRQKQWVWHLAVHDEARAAVAALVEAQRQANRSARLMHDERQQELVCIPPAEWAAVCAALAKFA